MRVGPQRPTRIEKLINPVVGLLGGIYVDDVDRTARHLFYSFSSAGTLCEGQMSIELRTIVRALTNDIWIQGFSDDSVLRPALFPSI